MSFVEKDDDRRPSTVRSIKVITNTTGQSDSAAGTMAAPPESIPHSSTGDDPELSVVAW
jgi:hypothetical protein